LHKEFGCGFDGAKSQRAMEGSFAPSGVLWVQCMPGAVKWMQGFFLSDFVFAQGGARFKHHPKLIQNGISKNR
jgi:hypothetical protein